MAKILYMDDSATARSIAKSILCGAGYDVLTVGTPEEARNELPAYAPDLLILDIFMGGRPVGLELAREIRNDERTRAAAILLAIGKMELFERRDLDFMIADGVVTKPLEASDLQRDVQQALELRVTRGKPDFAKLGGAATAPQESAERNTEHETHAGIATVLEQQPISAPDPEPEPELELLIPDLSVPQIWPVQAFANIFGPRTKPKTPSKPAVAATQQKQVAEQTTAPSSPAPAVTVEALPPATTNGAVKPAVSDEAIARALEHALSRMKPQLLDEVKRELGLK